MSADDPRERLRRAVEDAERLYRVRMHAPDGPTIADDNRIDGILTLDLPDALGAYDRLAAQLQRAQGWLGLIQETAHWYADNGDRLPHEVDHALCVQVLDYAEKGLEDAPGGPGDERQYVPEDLRPSPDTEDVPF